MFWALSRSGAAGWISRGYGGLDAGKKATYNSHIVSMLHAFIALYGGLVSYRCDNAASDALLSAFNSSPVRDKYLMVTSGYLIYDLILGIVYW